MSDKSPRPSCIWKPCVATWRHWHGGFPGAYDNPDDPEGLPIEFEGDDPETATVRDYNGAALRWARGEYPIQKLERSLREKAAAEDWRAKP